MTDKSLASGGTSPLDDVRGAHRWLPQATAVSSHARYDFPLRLFVAALFLPEGLSFFIGDFRLTAARALLIVLLIPATIRFFQRVNSLNSVLVPSDLIAAVAGIWMVLAAVATGGFLVGVKGGAASALEFTGAYYVFRNLLGSVDSSVRLIRYSCKVIVPVICVALLDPLSGKLFTYELVKGITGYVKLSYEDVYATESLFRNGLVRAMGPLEHSILFGAVCIWFGTLAICIFPSRLFGKTIASIAFIGVWFSQSRGPLAAYAIALGLAIFYSATKQFTARWKVLGSLLAIWVVFVFCYSRSPVATLLQLGGLDPEAGWYREAIWNTAGPLVLASPVFGIGLSDDWNWQGSDILNGASVDALWLRTAMTFGIPGSVFVFLTLVSAFWLGPIDRSSHLSRQEQRLSVALGIVVTSAVFLGLTVDFWGICWILLGGFSGVRANLAEAAIVRRRAATIHDEWQRTTVADSVARFTSGAK